MTDRRSGDDGDLTARIKRAQDATKPPPRSNTAEKYNQLSLAWRMTLELVVGAAIGGGLGYAIDQVTGLGPLFLIVLGLLGFAAGVKVVMATAQEASQSGRSSQQDDPNQR